MSRETRKQPIAVPEHWEPRQRELPEKHVVIGTFADLTPETRILCRGWKFTVEEWDRIYNETRDFLESETGFLGRNRVWFEKATQSNLREIHNYMTFLVFDMLTAIRRDLNLSAEVHPAVWGEKIAVYQS